MKKIICCILSVIILLSNQVYASEQTAQATVTYTCEDSFFIEIPVTIAVGEECYINAVEVNISPSKAIYVDLMINPDEYVRLYNESDNSKYIDAYFKDGEGNVLSVTDMNLATFYSGSGGTSQSFTTFVQDTTGKAAGAYSGIAMFWIHCE